MPKPEVVIVDYGVGNLLSVQRAIEHVGAIGICSSDPNVIRKADYVILPGVGAFGNAMEALNSLDLITILQEVAQRDTPLLGICLGMQLLFDYSEEFGITRGLGIIPGRVVPILESTIKRFPLKVPHIGWSELVPADQASWDRTLLEEIQPASSVYFVHSFMAVPDDRLMRLADCIYGENLIPAVVKKGSVTGCQFHPEKSGTIGLQILKEFIRR